MNPVLAQQELRAIELRRRGFQSDVERHQSLRKHRSSLRRSFLTTLPVLTSMRTSCRAVAARTASIAPWAATAGANETTEASA